MLIRKALLFAALFFVFQNVTAQYEFSTALKIQTNKKSIAAASAPGIVNLKNFILNPFAEGTDPSLIKSELEKFLSASVSGDSSGFKSTGAEDMPTPHGLITSLTGILNPALSESALIYAVTDVLVERAKEEIAAAYFDRMALKLEIPVEFNFARVPVRIVLKDLFPNFYLLVKNIRMNLNMQTGAVFNAAFEKDISAFYDNADKYLIPVEFKSTAAYTVVNSFYLLTRGVHENLHPAFIMRKIRSADISENSNCAENVLNIAAGISESLLNDSRDGYGGVWMDQRDFGTLNSDGLAYYLSLLYFNKRNITSFNNLGIHLEKLFGEKGPDLMRVSDVLSSAAGRMIQIQTMLENSSSGYAGGDKRQTLDSGALIAAEVLSAVRDIFSTDIVRKSLSEEDREAIWKGLNSAGYLKDFYVSLTNKNYGSAVLSALAMINQYTGEERINAGIVKYLTLAADICQAESSEAAAKIFEAAILPPGSYRLKRTSDFSSSVSAFAGISGGFEWLDKGNFKAAGYLSPFLPIGVDFTWSGGREEEQCDSKSVFLGLLDIGTVAGYRFKNSGDENLKAENVPPVKFQHIISPGIFFVYGFRNSPFAAGAGLQYSPRLRAVTDAQNIEVAKASALRIVIFIAVDIPLFNVIIK